MTTKQQKAIDHLAILITNYIGETDVGYENILVLNELYDKLHISPVLKNWWTARVSKAIAKTTKYEKED